jgi:hypothetical protein
MEPTEILIPAKAKIRPGVPTTTCGQSFFENAIGRTSTPPKDGGFEGKYLEKRLYSWAI